jgi:hypothetical protein
LVPSLQLTGQLVGECIADLILVERKHTDEPV